MGAKQPLLLPPDCPPPGDPGITAVLDLVASALRTGWIRLDVSPETGGNGTTYEHGSTTGAATSRALEVEGGLTAKLFFGDDLDPSADLLRSTAAALAVALDCNRLRDQTAVLRAAVDASSSFVLMFDSGGNIVYANPPADSLLSLQTEDELLVDAGGESTMPLFTALSSLVEQTASTSEGKPAWQGTLQSRDGRVLACEVTRLPHLDSVPETVLVLLRYRNPEPAVRIDAFCLTHGLSPREKEVVKLLIEGLTTLAMADRLSISPHTVRDHLKNLYRKTGTSSRSELLGLASRSAPATTGISA